jgi:hypothetical protein
MIVVVASAHDVRALRIVARWGSQCAAILSAEDLCMPGWVLQVPPDQPNTAVVGGTTISSKQIHGILTLRPCIFPEELKNIQPAHRRYVAAESNAFLLAWLTTQSCPVLNRPTACSLAGPNWRPEQWTQAAARLGIPAQTRRHIPNGDTAPNTAETVEVITVGERCFGCDDSFLKDRALRLAQSAGVDLLSVRFSADRSRFVSASVWPSFADPAVLETVRQRLENPQ